MFQFYVVEDKISLGITQRSADYFLGLPYNLASYSLLLCLVAKITNYKPYDMIWEGGDVHIYDMHFDAVEEMFNRYDTKETPNLPTLYTNVSSDKTLDYYDVLRGVSYDDIKLYNYKNLGHIKAPLLT